MNRNLNERFMKRLANEAPLGDTMAAKYQRAKTFDSLANDCEEIRLEALCRATDALESISKRLNDVKPDEQ